MTNFNLYTIEEALEVVDTLIQEKERWGKMAGIGVLTTDQLIEAITKMRKVGRFDVNGDDLQAKLTKANRQLGAAKAREAKLLKRLEGLSNPA
jgi:hypothetical protein